MNTCIVKYNPMFVLFLRFMYFGLQAAQRILKKALHSPKILSYSPKKRPSVNPWCSKERQALVQFIALFGDEIPQHKVWPSFGSSHPYWKKAAQLVQDTAKTKFMRSGTCFAKLIHVHACLPDSSECQQYVTNLFLILLVIILL